MHTAFDHPQFACFRFRIWQPPIRWEVIPGTCGNPTYTEADDLALVWGGEPPCPYRYTDVEALECWSGNCLLAAQELAEAMTPEHHAERQHPNGDSWWWELVDLWHLILHWCR